jgi:hypothetical protein
VSAYDSMVLIEPIQDLAWALMRPVSWSSLRALHFLQTLQFKVPPGLNTPVESSNWLAWGDWLAPKPLGSDRQLDPARFNVPNSYTACRKGDLPFWTKLRACHSPADRSEFSQRTARWSRLAAAALDFYR